MDISTIPSQNLSQALATYYNKSTSNTDTKFLIIKAKGVDQYHVVDKLGVIAYLIASLVAMLGGSPAPYRSGDLDSVNLAQSVSALNRQNGELPDDVSTGMMTLLEKIGHLAQSTNITEAESVVEEAVEKEGIPASKDKQNIQKQHNARIQEQHNTWIQALETLFGPQKEHNLDSEFSVQAGDTEEQGTLPTLTQEVLERGLKGNKKGAIELRMALNKLFVSGVTKKPETPIPKSPMSPLPIFEFGLPTTLINGFPSGVEVMS